MVCWPFAQHRKQHQKQHKEQQPLATRALTVLYFCFVSQGKERKGKRKRERARRKKGPFSHTHGRKEEKYLMEKPSCLCFQKHSFAFVSFEQRERRGDEYREGGGGFSEKSDWVSHCAVSLLRRREHTGKDCAILWGCISAMFWGCS